MLLLGLNDAVIMGCAELEKDQVNISKFSALKPDPVNELFWMAAGISNALFTGRRKRVTASNKRRQPLQRYNCRIHGFCCCVLRGRVSFVTYGMKLGQWFVCKADEKNTRGIQKSDGYSKPRKACVGPIQHLDGLVVADTKCNKSMNVFNNNRKRYKISKDTSECVIELTGSNLMTRFYSGSKTTGI